MASQVTTAYFFKPLVWFFDWVFFGGFFLVCFFLFLISIPILKLKNSGTVWARHPPKIAEMQQELLQVQDAVRTDLLLLNLNHESCLPLKQPKLQEQRPRPELLLPGLSCPVPREAGFPKAQHKETKQDCSKCKDLVKPGLWAVPVISKSSCLHGQVPWWRERRPVSGWASSAFLLPPSDSRQWDTAKANRAAARPTLLDYLYLQAKYVQLKTFHICLLRLAGSLLISVILRWQDKPPLTIESLWDQQAFKRNKCTRLFHKGVSVQGCFNQQMPPFRCLKSWSNLPKGPSQSQNLHPQCQPEGKPTCLLP